MRRRANSFSKKANPNPNPNSNSNLNLNSNPNQKTTEIEMTAATTTAVVSSPTLLARKRRTHSEMERGSFSSATEVIVAAAEKVTSSMDFDFDHVCSSPTSSSSSDSSHNEEDEVKLPLLQSSSEYQPPRERQSLLQQIQEQGENFQRSQFHIQNFQPGMYFPHIDMNLNMENFEFHNLPVEIQLALEDTLLGWTHLTSITIGHVLLPWLVFYTIQWASKYVLDQTVYTHSEHSSVEAVLVSPTTHFLLGLVAAIAAFRVIRHRRRVWFRHAYGSEGYKRCEEGRRRREAVRLADQGKTSLLSLSSYASLTAEQSSKQHHSTTWTSKIFSNYKRKRHRKKLRQASDRFERHHTGLTPVGSRPSITSPKSRLNSRRQKFWSGKESDYESTASVAPTEADCYDSYSSSDNDNDNNEDTRQPLPSTSEQKHDEADHPHKSSITHDAVSIPRIHNVPYAHGGFFGAAPFFLADRRWVKILRELLPDVYVEISRRVGGGFYSRNVKDASRLIHWAENNPVVAAYGVVMDLQIKKELKREDPANTTNHSKLLRSSSASSGNIIDHFYQKSLGGSTSISTNNGTVGSNTNSEDKKDTEDPPVVIPNLEWDIFVDPQLVRRVEAVLKSMDRYIASKTKAKSVRMDCSSSTDKEFGHATTKSKASPTAASSNEKNYVSDEDEYENDDIAYNRDDGESEAVALLADQDHDMNTLGININNLCGSTTNICTDCLGAGTPSPASGNHSGYLANDDSLVSPNRNDDNHDAQKVIDSLKNDPVLRYLELELEKRSQELTDRLLIAHGNVLQLMMEQSGVLKDWNYSRVQRTRRTLGGGMYARQWMAVFAESMRLGMNGNKHSKHCKKSKQRKRTTDDVHNFYEEEESDSSSGHSETSALLPPKRDEDSASYPEDEEDDDFDCGDEDLFERDHEDPLDDGDCACSPRCCLDTTMANSLKLIEQITHTKQPIGILLDLKSRHVPKRVLSLLVQSLQKSGIRVMGIASFEISDIRGVCSTHHNPHVFNEFDQSNDHNPNTASSSKLKIPKGLDPHPMAKTKEILMVHSAGDLQAACDEGLVRPGDHVFFNGGSLILDSARSSTIKLLAGFFFDMCVCGYYNTFDPCVIEDGYKIQSYGYACSGMESIENCGMLPNNENTPAFMGGGGSAGGSSNNPKRRKNHFHPQHHKNVVDLNVNVIDDDDTVLMSTASDDGNAAAGDETEIGAVMKTLADYKKYYGFSMGLYLQEFSIDAGAARLLVDLVNTNPQLYDLGLAWGGINGMTVHGIQPGRFTSTDGYWNQRRLGRVWKNPF